MPQKTATEILERAQTLLENLRAMPPREQARMAAEGITDASLVSLISKLTVITTLNPD